MKKITIYIVGICLVLLLLITIAASFSNNNKYYLKVTDGAVEIWQGKFAPMGTELLVTMPGAEPPESIQTVYSQKEVFPLAFNYYVDRADALLDASGMPDFEGIKLYLNKALSFGTTPDLMASAYSRLTSLDLMILMYKADVAASKGTLSGLQTALVYLNNASLLDLNDSQAALVKQKIESIKVLLPKPKPAVKQPETSSESQ